MRTVVYIRNGKADPRFISEDPRVLSTPQQIAAFEADEESAQAIADGVMFRGVRVSMSERSQITILGAYIARASLAYPFLWSSADDSQVIELDGPEDVEELFFAALGLVFAARQAGNAKKAAAR